MAVRPGPSVNAANLGARPHRRYPSLLRTSFAHLGAYRRIQISRVLRRAHGVASPRHILLLRARRAPKRFRLRSAGGTDRYPRTEAGVPNVVMGSTLAAPGQRPIRRRQSPRVDISADRWRGARPPRRYFVTAELGSRLGRKRSRPQTWPEPRDSEARRGRSRAAGQRTHWTRCRSCGSSVDDPPGPASLRGVIERNVIALLSHAQTPAVDTPSDGWLGAFSDREMVRASGLWNNHHVAETHDPSFLGEMDTLVTRWRE